MQFLRDPARCFLVVGGAVGVLLFVIMPPFSGIDEIYHFARTYQISEGDMLPQESVYHDAIRKGSGVCLPGDVVTTLEEYSAKLFIANLRFGTHGESGHDHSAVVPPSTTPSPTTTAPPSKRPSVASTLDRQCPTGRRYVDVSTYAWYSPVPYALGATAFAVVRPFDPSVDVLAYIGRFTELAFYLTVVFVAIRRAPRARWALCLAALLPVAMFQANSVSPDAFTTAMAILVLSSALRVIDREPGKLPRRVVVEALVLSMVLALAKPTYAVVALVYLVPLLDRERRRDSWVLLAPVAAGVLVSAAWQRATASLFVCDVRYFGIRPRPGDQATTILSQPWRFAGASVTAFADHGARWMQDVTTIGGRIVNWPTGIAVAAFLGFVVLACQQDRTPARPLAVRERLGLGVVFLLGVLAVLAGWLLYCNPAEMHVGPGLHARLFVPMIPVLFVAIAPDGRRATRFGNAAIPPAVALVAFYAIWLTDVARSLR
jgi:hypothetical protein